jgi:hypothetical protein
MNQSRSGVGSGLLHDHGTAVLEKCKWQAPKLHVSKRTPHIRASVWCGRTGSDALALAQDNDAVPVKELSFCIVTVRPCPLPKVEHSIFFLVV